MQLRHLANRLVPPTVAETPTFPAAPVAAARAPEPAPLAANTPDARAVLASLGDLVYEWDIVTDRLVWSGDLEKSLGAVAGADLSSGLAFGERLAPESVLSRYDAIFRSEIADEGDGVAFQAVYALAPPRESGSADIVWIEDNGRWFKGEDGRPARAHGLLQIVTERRRREVHLARHSQYDALTGVINRAHMVECMQRALVQAERSRKPFAVLLVALENLFSLNRTYGYDAGDQVIAGLATRLRDSVRAVDLVARHAGNKFAVMLDSCDSDQAKAAATRLIEVVAAEPFETSAGQIPVTIRIGGVVAPREGRNPQALLQHAEEALDVARQRDGARYIAYTASLAREDSRLRALQVADSIVSALNDRRVELAFQPIVHAATGEIAFHEALLRVKLTDGSTVTPSSILPIAEKAGLVRLLDQRVMELAIRRLADDPALRVSVNCSLGSLMDPEWPDRLANAVGLLPGLAERLTVEITETSVIEDFETVANLLAFCKKLGVKIAMDDFGAGHTSFRNLRRLAFDLVKIDGAFVQNIATSADDRFFVRTLTDLARHLGLKIVAEWVEDEDTARLLREWGVDYFQGALYGSAAADPANGAKAPEPRAAGF